MKSILLFICTITMLMACSGNKNHESPKTEATTIKHLALSDISSQLPEGIQLGEADIDTVWSDDLNCQAIRLTVNIKAEAKAFEHLHHKSNTISIDAKCSGENARSFTAGVPFEKERPKPYDLRSSNVLYNTQERIIIFEFPYRSLEMPAGTQNIKFSLAFYPTQFKIDAANKEQGFFVEQHQKSLGNWEGKTHIVAPELQKIKFTVKYVSLDNQKKDPKTYDLRYAGPGYPDLYWQLDCGGEKIYTSPVKDNVTEIKHVYSSSDFYCTAKDIIEIGVYDQDKTSKPDIVEIIKMTLPELRHKEGLLQNRGNLKKLEYQIQ